MFKSSHLVRIQQQNCLKNGILMCDLRDFYPVGIYLLSVNSGCNCDCHSAVLHQTPTDSGGCSLVQSCSVHTVSPNPPIQGCPIQNYLDKTESNLRIWRMHTNETQPKIWQIICFISAMLWHVHASLVYVKYILKLGSLSRQWFLQKP